MRRVLHKPSKAIGLQVNSSPPQKYENVSVCVPRKIYVAE